ncbi:hypothetical protein [Actinokineospora sp. NBRC 105648]|uniref:hypothetical protein n=1 Tax=Actinokineospora sp. NBRC 105648 TaxID=3032206 RepID=UPI0025541C1E|nr:hypothetical protein [Actinokineospora sp. NBRC 105648]
MFSRLDAGDLVVWVLGVSALVLLAVSLVLTLSTGESTVRNSTGAAGGILVGMWAAASTGNDKDKAERGADK